MPRWMCGVFARGEGGECGGGRIGRGQHSVRYKMAEGCTWADMKGGGECGGGGMIDDGFLKRIQEAAWLTRGVYSTMWRVRNMGWPVCQCNECTACLLLPDSCTCRNTAKHSSAQYSTASPRLSNPPECQAFTFVIPSRHVIRPGVPRF